MENTRHKKLHSFYVNEELWTTFKLYSKILGKYQFRVLDDLINNWIITHKAEVNDIIFKLNKRDENTRDN